VVSYGDRKTEAFKFENYKLEEIAKPAPLIADRISADRVARFTSSVTVSVTAL
jgi:hypothetical protein